MTRRAGKYVTYFCTTLDLSMASFLSNPDLPFVRPDFPGNYFDDGQFYHAQYASGIAPLSRILQWQLAGNPQNQEKANDPFRVKCVRGSSFLRSSEDMLVWLGHASFFIRMQGITMITDPCWTDLPIIKRRVGLPCAVNDFKNIDYLLLSHGHRDHYDTDCVNRLIVQNPRMEVLMPLRLSELLGSQRDAVPHQEAAWWQRFHVKSGLEIIFLPAKHWNRRWLNDFNQQLWGSFLLRSEGRTVYFAGDSAYADHFTEIRQLLGAPDISLLPVGAYKPPFMMQEAHMKPTEAVQAFHDLESKTMIPIHYGTYDLSDEPMGEPVRRLKAMRDEGSIEGELEFLDVGELLFLTS